MAAAGGSSAPPSGAAAYKKKDGVLAMSEDRGSISWVPAAGGGKNGTVKISVGNITSMYMLLGAGANEGALCVTLVICDC